MSRIRQTFRISPGPYARGLFTASLLLLLLGQRAAAGERFDVVSPRDFGKTVDKLVEVLKANHMMIVATIDHQNMLSMVGARIKGSTTIEFGKPDMGKTVFAADPAAGLEMPGKIYVYERGDGKTIVSYETPSPGYARYGKPELAQVGQMMDQMMAQIVAEATRPSPEASAR